MSNYINAMNSLSKSRLIIQDELDFLKNRPQTQEEYIYAQLHQKGQEIDRLRKQNIDIQKAYANLDVNSKEEIKELKERIEYLEFVVKEDKND